jgi:AcrR family transcriptional regulator
MTGAAPTARSGRRSTSSRSKADRTSTTVPYPAAARGLLRDTIIDAVDELARTQGWPATTMTQIAEIAGVSRQTVYNEFGSRQALVEAYVRREIDNLVTEVEHVVRANADDPEIAVHSAFGLFLRLASDEPVIRIIVADSDPGPLVQLLTRLGLGIADDRIARLIMEVWPQVAAADAELLADSLVRLAISHAVSPMSDPATVTRNVTRLVKPLIAEMLS